MKIFLARTFAIALVLVLSATGLWAAAASEAEPAAAAEKEMVLDPRTGEMVEAPRYGGTLTYATRMTETGSADSFFVGHSAILLVNGVLEKPGIANWALPRDEWGMSMISAYSPLSSLAGNLAESWETPDDSTIVLNIRKGVHWHDKPPMNGRELTADDLVFNYHRMLGLGDFTELSVAAWNLGAIGIESVTASDKWTVVIELERPRFGLDPNEPLPMYTVQPILQSHSFFIYPPEVIKEHGDANDWRNLVGTGPFMLTDYVDGSSVTFIKNPDYWRFDEKYPDNRLPYVDELTGLIMKEEATRIAALRSGKIDYMGSIGNTQVFSLDTVESLGLTNPEIAQWPFSQRSDWAMIHNVSNPPFNDIRVRKAMQMALDLETINETFFKGRADTTPHGQLGDSLEGMFIPFDEWPEEVKKGYMYDPEGAEKLLDEAGYPRGTDGVRFKTSFVHRPQLETSYFELVAAYWREIGVELEIQVPSSSAEVDALYESREALMGFSAASQYFSELHVTGWETGYARNRAMVSDPQVDAMIDALRSATDIEEYTRLFREIDLYSVAQHWVIWGPDSPQYQFTQPWVKGYNGEATMGDWQFRQIFARVWIDQELKAEMGY